jgi:hypothetical protein
LTWSYRPFSPADNTNARLAAAHNAVGDALKKDEPALVLLNAWGKPDDLVGLKETQGWIKLAEIQPRIGCKLSRINIDRVI